MSQNWKDVDEYDDYYQWYVEGGEEGEKPKGKYDDEMNNFKSDCDGIKRDRSCTDILCLVLFWAHIAGVIYLAMEGSKNGQFDKLMAPIDAAGNFCGWDKDYKDYPSLLITDYSNIANPIAILGTGVCVKKCPDVKALDKAFENGVDCKDNEKAKCADGHYSKTLSNPLRICMPLNANALDETERKGFNEMKKALMNSAAGKTLEDLYKSSTSIFMSFGMALVWSLVYIYIMSIFAEALAWCCVVLLQLGLIAASAGCFFLWDQEKKSVADQQANTEAWNKLSTDEKAEIEKQPKIFFWMGIITGLLALIFLCLVCCGRDSLRTAIDVIDASADYVAHNKRVIFVPNVHFLMTLIVIAVWLFAFLNVCSLNTIEVGIIPQTKSIKWEKKLYKYYALYMIFSVLWLTAFIEYTSRFIVITGACTYYFNNHRDKKDEENGADIMFGVKCAYIYHAGGIATGAFIIALIRFIKLVFYYLAKKMEKASGDNPAIKCAVKCAICCLNCIEKVCDYLNEAAFCYMAVTGKGFWPSAWEGFLLNLKHGLKFGFANLIAKVFIFLGKIGIVAGNCFTLYGFMKMRNDLEEVTTIYGPIIIVAVFTYVASSIFLSLFEEAVMALCTCVCFDMDMNGGEAHYGPATFHDKYNGAVDKANEQQAKKSNEMA